MADLIKFRGNKKKRPYPEFLFTTDACVVNHCEQGGIPILIDEHNQIVWPVVHYFTYLKIVEDRPNSSLKTMSDHIRMFWEFMSREGVGWQDVDDDLLTGFRNRQRKGEKVSHGQGGTPQHESTINGRLITILAFYWWCRNNGLVSSKVIGPTDWQDGEFHYRPQIAVDIEGHDPRSNRPYRGLRYKSHLLYKNPRKPSRDVPTDDQVSKMHASLGKVRDVLLAQWTELTSLRVHELGRLLVSHIPTYEEIDEIREDDSFHRFKLKGKRGVERWIYVKAELLESTRDYIELERAEIVEKKGRSICGYNEPKEIFLDETKGNALKKDTISKYISAGFKEAGFENRLHDLRAKYATDTVRAEIDNAIIEGETLDSLIADGFSTILLKVAERLGHARIETLRPYIVLEKKRILGNSKVAVAAKVEESIIDKKRRLDILVRQIEEIRKLKCIAEKLKVADYAGAIDDLEQLIVELKSND